MVRLVPDGAGTLLKYGPADVGKLSQSAAGCSLDGQEAAASYSELRAMSVANGASPSTVLPGQRGFGAVAQRLVDSFTSFPRAWISACAEMTISGRFQRLLIRTSRLSWSACPDISHRIYVADRGWIAESPRMPRWCVDCGQSRSKTLLAGA